MLWLTTFGGVALRRDCPDDRGGTAGEQQPAKRGLALLVLLAAAPDAGISRDSLLTYLWPESDEERARSALRQTLFSLRRELGAPELVVGGVGLRLNPADLTSDVRAFELARASGDLERAVRLYAGPFLDGFHLRGTPEFERWVERQRVEYAARTAGALETLARRAGQQGDAGTAATWWRRLSVSDPLNTRFVLELMAAEAAAGNAGGAIRLAEAHEALVREELGAAPDPALAALVARIRAGAPLGGRMSESSPPAPPRAVPAPAAAGRGIVREPEHLRELLQRELGDRYVLEPEAETGREGHTRLLSARDRRHDRPVTLKVLNPPLASRIDVERFVREIRFTGRLLHPHILPLLDSGEVAGRPWFAVPRPKGETLRNRLSREGQVPADEAVRLTRELADALGQAHAEGIVHRDVSPENVLLAASPPRDAGTVPGCHALLTNLGLARALDVAAGAELTVTGMLVGTPAYMSPEQAEGDRPIDGRSDVYSLAAVLFEMLTGEPLFSGPTPQAIMAKRAADRSALVGRLEDVPPPVAAVMIKALAKNPEARFRSAADFAAGLDPSSQPLSQPSGGWRRWLGLGG
jgi:DNA-binding SARP family transcriptional activator